MLHRKHVPHFFLNTPMVTLVEFVRQAAIMARQERKKMVSPAQVSPTLIDL